MSTEPTPGNAGDPTPAPDDGGGDSKQTDFVSSKKFEQLQREKDFFAGKARKLEDQIEALTARVTELDSGDGKAKPNERLQAAEAKIRELSDAVSAKDAKIRDFTVKSKVLEKAQGTILPEALEAFWQLEGAKFDIVEFNGEQLVGLKDQPYTKLEDYFDEAKTRLGFMIASPRAKGTGDPAKGDVKPGGQQMSAAQIKALSDSERTKLFAGNPELRRKYALGQL
jgi:hypothetical protein